MRLAHHIQSVLVSVVVLSFTACGNDASEDLLNGQQAAAGGATVADGNPHGTGKGGASGASAGVFTPGDHSHAGGAGTAGSAQAGAAGSAQAGSSGSAQAGTTGSAGTDGTAGTSSTAGSSGTSATAGSGGTTGGAGTTGSAGSAQAGAAGSAQAGSSGSAQAGTTGSAGNTGTAGTSSTAGSSGTSATAGSGGTTGSAGTGGSQCMIDEQCAIGFVCTNHVCVVGSSGAGGATGGAGMGGTAGSAQAGTSGAAGTGGSAGSGTTMAPLTLIILSPVEGLSHVLSIKAQELIDDGNGGLTARPGGISWSSPQADFTSNNSKILATMQVALGSTLKFNGEYDPDPAHPWAHALCVVDATEPTGARPIAPMGALFNGQFTAPIKAKAHVPADGGCDLWVVDAPSALISATDADGDGFSPNDPNPLLRDCDDADGMKNPAQVESWDDSLDLNCDGSIDPDTVKIRYYGATNGVTPMVNADGGATYTMAWNSQGFWETVAIAKSAAPKKFYLSWPQGSTTCSFAWQGTCYDSSYYDNVCHGLNTDVQMYDINTGDLIEVDLLPEGSPAWTCRRVAKL